MQKLSSFFKKSSDQVFEQTKSSLQTFSKDIERKSQHNQPNSSKRVKSSLDYGEQANQDRSQSILVQVQTIYLDRPLENAQLQQSKIIPLQSKVYSQKHIRNLKGVQVQKKGSLNGSRIKQIEQQKRRILQQLKKIDGQIAQIKQQKDSGSLQKSQFHKKTKISDDIQAKKQAQSLVKQLHLQRMKIQQNKRKQQQKQLQKQRKQEQLRRKQREQIEKKLKQQKRLVIERRMGEEHKKRIERLMVDKQSNQLISELKKQEQLEKQRQILPGQMLEYQQKKKLLQKKNNFNIYEIQEHQRKYKDFKSKQKQLRRERSQSIKPTHYAPKYAKNIWVEKIEQEQTRKKQQEKIKQLNRRLQLQKRMKYGDIVKNIFMSKHKKKQDSQQKASKQQSINQGEIEKEKKPRTPDVISHLPQIPRSDQKRQNQTDKKFKERQQSHSIIQNKKSRVIQKAFDIKQKDPQQFQKLQKIKQRQQQIRKQTKQRLKKLENKSIDIPKSQKVKYENYMQKVKVKKQDPHEQWKRIMSNQKLSKEEKYKQMLSKATMLENQAKVKQDLRKSGDQEAVNLYIGSIQAKLALLQRF